MTFPHDAGHPLHRPRRLRSHARLRDLVREHRLTVDDLVYPLFVYHGKNLRREIASIPRPYQRSPDPQPLRVGAAAAPDIPARSLFGIPALNDATGSDAPTDGSTSTV